MKSNKKATNEVGGAILVMAALLFFGGFFFDSDFEIQKKDKYEDKKYNDRDYEYETYLFFLNETDLGKQKKVTESFPNIELGSIVENNIIYIGNSFRLDANPFSKNEYNFKVDLSAPEDVSELLLYFNTNRISGDNELLIRINGETIRTLARSSDMPIKIPMRTEYLRNFTGMYFTFEVSKPKIYQLLNWNKVDIESLQVVEVSRNKANNYRKFNFDINHENLDRVYLDLAIECETKKEISEAIEIKVNDYIISNQNPSCLSRYNTITANVPLNILNEGKNDLELNTEGFYTLAYSVNKIEYNDKQVYKFNVNNFNNLNDIVMYGDFDKEVIDIRFNGEIISLRRDEIKSVIEYIRIGTNEIKFLDQPLEIEEFIIEKSEFNY